MIKKQNYFEMLPVLLLLLTAGGIPYVFFRKTFLFGLFLLFFVLLFKKISVKELGIVLAISLLTLLFLLVNYLFAVEDQSTQKLFANVAIFSIGLLAAIYYSRVQNRVVFVKGLYLSLKIVLYHALIAAFVYPFIKQYLFPVENWHYTCSSFGYLFYYMPERYGDMVLGGFLTRNQGLFWEPGILQIHLNLLFFLEAFIFKRNRIIIWLIIIALLTTYSTTGLVILLIQIVIYSREIMLKNIFLAPIALLSIFSIYMITKDNIDKKTKGDTSYSYQVRLFDLLQPVNIVLKHPWTGVGLDYDQYIILRDKVEYALTINEIHFTTLEKGSSNSITYFLAAAGIPSTILLVFLFSKQNFIHEKRKWFLFFLITSLMTEPLLLKPFFVTIFMSGAIHLISNIKWKTY